jgi:hypothetical protein
MHNDNNLLPDSAQALTNDEIPLDLDFPDIPGPDEKPQPRRAKASPQTALTCDVAAPKDGNPSVEKDQLAAIVEKLGLYYDSGKLTYYGKNNRGGWVAIQAHDAKRWIAQAGFKTRAREHQTISEADAILVAIQKINDVDYAGSLAGHKMGIYEIEGARILVKDSPVFVEPRPGDWPLWKGIILRMLGPEQQTYLFGWLKTAVRSLCTGSLRHGQAMVLVGPKACGKSLLQNELFTPLLGGRSTKSYRYMSGKTPFNAELLGSEHLMVEDEAASTDIRARRNFASEIKQVTGDKVTSCHPKFRTAISLTPFWRLSITLNDEPENLLILPPLEESLSDKLIILKADFRPMPMPTVTDVDRVTFARSLRAELPHFVDFLLHLEIPRHLQSERYGMTHYQHPDILEALSTLAPETKLLDLIDTVLFNSAKSPQKWKGKAAQLEELLIQQNSPVRQSAMRLLSFPTACGIYLGRLGSTYPERFSLDHKRDGNYWIIQRPTPPLAPRST